MARRHGRCRRGERLRAGIPFGYWKTATFVAGLRRAGMIAPWVLDGPMKTLQKFALVHASVHNHFSLERHLVDRKTYKHCRSAALAEWQILAS